MLSLWKCAEDKCYYEDDRIPNQILVVISKPEDGEFTWLRVHDPKVPVQASEMLKWALYVPEEHEFILIEEWRGTDSAKTTFVKESSLFDDFKRKQGKTETMQLQIQRLRRMKKKLEHREEIRRRGLSSFKICDRSNVLFDQYKYHTKTCIMSDVDIGSNVPLSFRATTLPTRSVPVAYTSWTDHEHWDNIPHIIEDVLNSDEVKRDEMRIGRNYRQDLLTWVRNHEIGSDMLMARFQNIQYLRGSLYKVYKVKDLRTDNVRALCLTQVRHDNDQQTLVDFAHQLYRARQETLIMEGLQGSDYVVKIYDTYVSRAMVAHVLEMPEFGFLDAHIPTNGMAPELALACTFQIMSALSYIHARGVVHFNVKPQNIMVCRGGQLKLTNFGVSMTYHDNGDRWILQHGLTDLTRYPYAGTPGFMAPEIIRGFIDQSISVSVVDSYSAGITFLMLLTNFQGLDYDTLRVDPLSEALRCETSVKRKSCNRCKILFESTLKVDFRRKSAKEIVKLMSTWTRRLDLRFNDKKSKRIVSRLIRDKIGGQGESKNNDSEPITDQGESKSNGLVPTQPPIPGVNQGNRNIPLRL